MREDVPRAVTVIGNALREQIEHGLLPPGHKLPAERTLSEVFATTRITLREALVQLETQGLIYREERRGWFVSPPRLTYDLSRSSHFHAMVQSQGREAHTELVHARLKPASASICETLQLPALSSVVQICQAGRVDGRLVLYVEHYLNPAFFPGILECDLGQSLTELYADRYGLRHGRVQFEIRPTALHPEACTALKASAGSPGLCISRANFDLAGRLLDCTLEYWRHDAICVSAMTSDTGR